MSPRSTLFLSYDDRVRLGAALRKKRKDRNLSAEALAAEAGISPRTVQRIENVEVFVPMPSSLDALAAVFGYADGTALVIELLDECATT